MELLTEAEIKLVEDIGHLMGAFVDISGGNPKTHSADMREVCTLVHALQEKVLAQAAARAFPGQFRRLGAMCEDDDPTPINDALERDIRRSTDMEAAERVLNITRRSLEVE